MPRTPFPTAAKPTALSTLQAAVAATALALGVATGVALQRGRSYWVKYPGTGPHLVHTEACGCPRRALLRYQKAIQHDLVYAID